MKKPMKRILAEENPAAKSRIRKQRVNPTEAMVIPRGTFGDGIVRRKK